MLHDLSKRPQRGFLPLHLLHVSQVSFTHLSSRFLLIIRQDVSRLVDELVRTSQGRPEAGGCLKPFQKELVELF